MPRADRTIIVGGLACLMAGGYLAYAAMRGGWVYYREVDAFLAAPTGERVRLHGVARFEREAVSGADLRVGFELVDANAGTGRGIAVEYVGVRPDQFMPGGQVVAEGRLGADGVFHADLLLTKCGSKYEAKVGVGTDRNGGGR